MNHFYFYLRNKRQFLSAPRDKTSKDGVHDTRLDGLHHRHHATYVPFQLGYN